MRAPCPAGTTMFALDTTPLSLRALLLPRLSKTLARPPEATTAGVSSPNSVHSAALIVPLSQFS